MIYKIGMLCKHFKGKTLLEKNIYRIEKVGVLGCEIDNSFITYTGDNDLMFAQNLVIYSNVFQDYKLFAREYEDLCSILPIEMQELYHQKLRVEVLSDLEINMINSDDFINEKKKIVLSKFKK